MNMNMSSIVEECVKVIKEKTGNLDMLNIAVVGKTGVGKSTLINNVFRENLAQVGIGEPMTKHMKKITKRDFPLGIYDTRGFELGKEAQKEVKKELLDEIRKTQKTNNMNEQIHCIWYCVQAGSGRLEPEERDWIREFTEESNCNIPIIVVLTQAFQKSKAKELQSYIESLNMNVKKVIPVLAEEAVIDEDYTVKAYGLDTLIEVMADVLPEELVDTLANVQKVNLKLKQKKAQAAVVSAAAAAVLEGGIPVPFVSDAALLIPTEVTMLASITVIFGFEINKSILTAIVSSVIGTSGATIAGKMIVANLLKMIPGAGTLVGSGISATTAATLTTALGEAYIGVMTAMYKGEMQMKELETEKGREKMKNLFRRELKEMRKTNQKSMRNETSREISSKTVVRHYGE